MVVEIESGGLLDVVMHRNLTNVFVERLWRSVKYERVYLKACDSVSAARADIARPHRLVQLRPGAFEPCGQQARRAVLRQAASPGQGGTR